MPTIKRLSRSILRNVAAQVTRQVADAAIIGSAIDSVDRAQGHEEWQAAASDYRRRAAIADALHDFALDNIDRFLADNAKDTDE